MIDFSGKNVLVTGGSRGIGAAIVELFARLHANVALSYLCNEQAAQKLIARLGQGSGKIISGKCDTARQEQVDVFIDFVLSQFVQIDVLVNNAGIWEYGGPVESMPTETWKRTLQINLDGCFYFASRVAGLMKKANGGGNIIFIASTAGQRGEPFYSQYAASKGAVIAFTKSLAAELGMHGIRVNCVAPGWVRTDMTRDAFNTREEEIRSKMLTGKIPGAGDIAGPVVFLASDWASAITGEILNVNAGSVLYG